MKIIAIAAANVESARDHSASVRACQVVRDLLHAQAPQAQVEIVPLLDYDLKPCRMCGRCQKDERCALDPAFNQVFERLIAADGIFMVVPHYAPLPSKLMMLCEKMQEIAFLNWVADQNYRFPLAGKPAGVVAHGGQPGSPEVLAYYQRALVDPVAQSLESISLKIVSAGPDAPRGVAFGIRSIARRPGTVFVDIEHDWQDIRERLSPLVQNVAAALNSSAA